MFFQGGSKFLPDSAAFSRLTWNNPSWRTSGSEGEIHPESSWVLCQPYGHLKSGLATFTGRIYRGTASHHPNNWDELKLKDSTRNGELVFTRNKFKRDMLHQFRTSQILFPDALHTIIEEQNCKGYVLMCAMSISDMEAFETLVLSIVWNNCPSIFFQTTSKHI